MGYTTWTYMGANKTQAVAQAAEDAAALDTSPTLSRGESCDALASIHAPTGNPHCQYARPCQSCLQKAGCAISPTGDCYDATSGSVNELDYRTALDQTLVVLSPNLSWNTNISSTKIPQKWYFPAGSAAYCGASDRVCQECRAKRFAIGDSARVDSRFCVGANGCVCIANCVDPEYTLPAAHLICTYEYYESESSNTTVQHVVMSAVTMVMVCMIACLWRSVRRRQGREQLEAERRRLRLEAQAIHRAERLHQMSTTLGVGVLSLSAWKTHHQNRIQDEEIQLSGLRDLTLSYQPLEDPQVAAQVS